jgi:uncharacterized C2H2 Zn-finger protein
MTVGKVRDWLVSCPHCGSKVVECSYCDRVFQTDRGLGVHVYRAHQELLDAMAALLSRMDAIEGR